MSWIELPPLGEPVETTAVALTSWGPAQLASGPVTDHMAAIWPEERNQIAAAGPRRRRQFSTGRHLAHRAMAALGRAGGPVSRTADGGPIWPGGLVGSISHSGQLALAAVARAEACGGLGVDLEEPARVGPHLYRRLFTAAERESLAQGDADPRLAGLLFAAKEAGYKLVQPRVGRYIGFQEAEVSVDWAGGTWRLRYLGDHEPNRLMEHGEGSFGFCGPYVIALLALPPDLRAEE